MFFEPFYHTRTQTFQRRRKKMDDDEILLGLLYWKRATFSQTSCATTIIWYSHKLQTNKFVFMRYNLKLETTWISSPLLRSCLKYKSFSLSLQNVCLFSNLVCLHLKIFTVTIKLVYATGSEYGTKVIDKAGNVSWHWHCMKAWWFIDKSSEE